MLQQMLTLSLSPRGERTLEHPLRIVKGHFSPSASACGCGSKRCRLAKASWRGEGQDEGDFAKHSTGFGIIPAVKNSDRFGVITAKGGIHVQTKRYPAGRWVPAFAATTQERSIIPAAGITPAANSPAASGAAPVIAGRPPDAAGVQKTGGARTASGLLRASPSQ
jgi:hypothetical protein